MIGNHKAVLFASAFLLAAGASTQAATLFFDDFENGSLATGGPGTVNAGFTSWTAGTGDSIAETGGNAVLNVATSFRRSGYYSNTALDILGQAPDGFTATFDFSNMDLATSGQVSHMRVGVGELYLTVVKQGNGNTTYGMGIRNNFDNNQHNYHGPTLLGNNGNNSGLSVDRTSLEDGFQVEITADPTGWSLNLPNTSVAATTHSGTWAEAGTTYTDVFDGTKIGAGSTNNELSTIDTAGVVISHEFRKQDRDLSSSLDSVIITATPIPEPSTMLMASIAVIIMASFHYRSDKL